MGLPSSKSFNPSPHQMFEAEMLASKLQTLSPDPKKAPYQGELIFWEGARFGDKYHYGGKFNWSEQPDNSKPKKWDGKYQTKHVLCYSPRPSRQWHDVESVQLLYIQLECEEKPHLAVWKPDLYKWILCKEADRDLLD